MDFEEYLSYFSKVIDAEQTMPPYDDPEYFAYAKLNWSRTQRWLKRGELLDSVQAVLSSITRPQEWLVITEPWCGDAAHALPFIYKMASQNPLVRLSFHLRDQPPHLIDSYLTNGGKSIPKLIVRDEEGKDMFTWGPRPQAAQRVFDENKAAGKDLEFQKESLQHWYNADKGESTQREIADLLAQSLDLSI
jgi:hypothetical protein